MIVGGAIGVDDWSMTLSVAFRSRHLAKQLPAEKGDDAAWFRDAFAPRTIRACIPARAKGSHPAIHAVRLSQQRHTMENMFGRLTDWRRLPLRDDRCAHTVFTAIGIAATGFFGALINASGP